MLFVWHKYGKLNLIGEWASDGVRSYTTSMYPAKKKNIYFPPDMSDSIGQWCIWKVHQRPIGPHNNISKVYMAADLEMTKLFLHTRAGPICENQITLSLGH